MNNGKPLAIASLVLGIVSIVFFWVTMFNIVALICGVAGIVLAIIAKKKATEAGETYGLLTAALVCSIVGAALSLIGFLTCTLCYICTLCSIQNSYGELGALINALS